MATYVYTPKTNADGSVTLVESVNGQPTGATSENRNWQQGNTPSSTPTSSSETVNAPSYSTPTGGSFDAKNESGKTVTGTYGNGMNDWTDIGQGNSGKKFAKSNNNNSILVVRPDGSKSVVNPGDANYQATIDAAKADGINWDPTYTTTVHRNVNNNGEIDWDKSQTFTTQAYLPGNEALQKAFTEAGKQQPGISINEYAKRLYDSLGTEGGFANIDSLNAGLGALGLSDFDTNNAIFTAGQNIIPGGNAARFGYYDDTAGNNIPVNGKPQGGLYYTYGGQSYLIDGDAANFAQYVNGKTGNWTASDFILGNVAGNPIVQGDKDLNQIAQAGTNYYNNLGNTPGTQVDANGVIQPGNVNPTGNSKVDATIGFVNNAIDYAIQTGDSDLYEQVVAILTQGLRYQQEFLDRQRDRAESKASDQKSSAWVSSQIAARNLKDMLSSQGLGTTGALVGGMVGLNSNYNNAIGQINDGLIEMLSNLDSEELKLLSDHFNSLGQYKYQIGTAELERALQREKMAQDQDNADREYEFKVGQDLYNREQDALNREQNAQSVLTKEQQQKFDNAYKLLSAGVVTQEVADALGLTLAEAQKYAAQLTASKKSSGGGKDKNPSPTPTPEAEQIINPYDPTTYMPEGMPYNKNMFDWDSFLSDVVNDTVRTTGSLPGVGPNQTVAQQVAQLLPLKNR